MTDPVSIDDSRMLILDRTGRPTRHWAGRTQAVKVLRGWVCAEQPHYVSQDEATEIVEDILQAYLDEQR